MRKLPFVLVVSFTLMGCEIEDVAKETRDLVGASVVEISQTKEGAQVATALENCLNPELSVSARVAACKPVLLKLPEDRLSDYMGIPMRVMQEEAVKKSVDFPALGQAVEIELPNVLYVGKPASMDFDLELAPTSEELLNVLRMAVLQVTGDLGLKAMKPGVTAEEMEVSRGYARRLVFISTAIMGAVKMEDVRQAVAEQVQAFQSQNIALVGFQEGVTRSIGKLSKIVPQRERVRALEKLRVMARNLSLTETELRTLTTLGEIRLGIR